MKNDQASIWRLIALLEGWSAQLSIAMALKMATTVYCDDAGFTGDNLLNRDQPFFAYSAVAIEPSEAADLVAELRQSFNLAGRELKGKDLYDRSYAITLITLLANRLQDRVSIALNDKLFSLAAKFFEYVYEPSIAANSRFFYERGTHVYVATVLWAFLNTGDPTTRQIADRFEALMRRRSGQPLLYFDESFAPGQDDAIAPIMRFAIARKDSAIEELDSLANENGRIRWVLDLSLSSARSVLATLGERVGEIDVTMDESKPLEDFVDFMSVFVGRTDTQYMELGGRRRPLTFNLQRVPRFGSSKEDPGLQIADLFASFAALSARDRHTSKGAAILNALLPILDADTVLPDYGALDLEKKSTIMNLSLVTELADRAEAGAPLLSDIEAYYDTMSYYYDRNPPRF